MEIRLKKICEIFVYGLNQNRCLNPSPFFWSCSRRKENSPLRFWLNHQNQNSMIYVGHLTKKSPGTIRNTRKQWNCTRKMQTKKICWHRKDLSVVSLAIVSFSPQALLYCQARSRQIYIPASLLVRPQNKAIIDCRWRGYNEETGRLISREGKVSMMDI